jgi:hypothetical protein
VDRSRKRGWSAKTLKWKIEPGAELELVIQRADVFDKAEDLGFPGLSTKSKPGEIGAAVLKHWGRKIAKDMAKQGVTHARTAILLKSDDRKTFYLYEHKLHVYNARELRWSWATADKKGLKGVLKANDFNVFKFYPNQKQLFERYALPDKLEAFTIDRRQLEAERVVQLLLAELEKSPSPRRRE